MRVLWVSGVELTYEVPQLLRNLALVGDVIAQGVGRKGEPTSNRLVDVQQVCKLVPTCRGQLVGKLQGSLQKIMMDEIYLPITLH